MAGPDLPEDWREIVRRNAAVLYKRTGWRGLVEFDELVNEGVVGLLEASVRTQGGEAHEAFWGMRARGAMVDLLRRLSWGHRRQRDFQDTAPFSVELLHSFDAPSPADQHAPVEERVDLIRSWRTLKSRERFVLAAHYFRGLNLGEIGRELGVGESRVCQLHRAGLARLRRAMEARPERRRRRPA